VTAGLPRRLRCCETRVWLCPRGEIALALRWEVAWGDLREGRAQVGNVEGVQWRKFGSKLRHDSQCLQRTCLQRTLYCLISKKKIRPRPLGLEEHHATSQIHSHSSDMSNPTAASPLALSVSNLAAPWLQRAKRPKRREGRAVV
jgi:hypothetical protein